MNRRTFLIIGATGSLGGEIAKGLLPVTDLFITGRKRDKILAVADRLASESTDASVNIWDLDLYSEDSMKRMVEYLEQNQVQISGVVKVAGGNRGAATLENDRGLEDIDVAACEALFAENMRGQLLIAKYLLPQLAKSPFGGCYVSIGSMAGISPLTKVGTYSALMAAEMNYVQWLSLECALRFGDKVRCNVVAPGFVPSEQNRKLMFANEAQTELTPRGQAIINGTPFHRFGKPEEIVGAVKFLLGDEARFINGTVIRVDGGYSTFSGV